MSAPAPDNIDSLDRADANARPAADRREPVTALAAMINQHRRDIENHIQSMSGARLRAWVVENHTDLAAILRAGIVDPAIVLPTLLAVKERGSADCFGGDAVLWYAANAGFGAKDANRYLRVARWMYRPQDFPLGPEFAAAASDTKLKARRELQTRLRRVFNEMASSMWVIDTCKRQTDFLCDQAKGHVVPIIEQVVRSHGRYPCPKAIMNDLQQAVHEANRAYIPDQGNHSYIRFTPARGSMMAFYGFCTKSEGALIQAALKRRAKDDGVDPTMERDKRAFQALKSLCREVVIGAAEEPGQADQRGGGCERDSGVRYRVNVNVTLGELQELQAKRRRHVETDRGEKVDWELVTAGKLSVVDAVTVIAQHGAQMVEAPGNRFFSPEQRDWMENFQVRCAHPGCTIAARDCQAHHIRPVSRGGATTTDNLVLVCEHHHALNDDSHEAVGRFHYEKDSAGIPYLQMHSPAGQPRPAPRYNAVNLTSPASVRARRQAS